MNIPTPKAVAMLIPSITPKVESKPVAVEKPSLEPGPMSISARIGEEQAKALLSLFTK
jgi:hypothetical protein